MKHFNEKEFIPLVVETDIAGKFSLFPNEANKGIGLSNKEMLKISDACTEIYPIYISRMAECLSQKYALNKSTSNIIARRALVPLTHCFIDRLFRIKKAVDLYPKKLSAPHTSFLPVPDTIESFENLTITSYEFNQSMVSLFSSVWNFPASEILDEQVKYKSERVTLFGNNLFILYLRSPLWLIKRAILKVLALVPYPRFAALSLGTTELAFFEHGFYTKRLKNIAPSWSFESMNSNTLLREEIFSSSLIKKDDFINVARILDLNDIELNNLLTVFKKYLRLNFPVSFLESIPIHKGYAEKYFKLQTHKVLITSGGRCTRSTFLFAEAKEKGFFIVDCQHGGHYGYIKDLGVFLELEYHDVDQFISWGWTSRPSNFTAKNISIKDLPSPWLSERKKYWGSVNIFSSKEFDVLLLPNNIKRFPASPQASLNARIDLIHEISCSLKHLVRSVTSSGLRLLIKPYNIGTNNLLSKTMDELEEIGGGLYACEKQLDKGLTHELIARCRIVLWDQPGTGFLECMSSGIPTMVYWPDIFSSEEEWVKPYINNFEDIGLIHRNANTLVNEIKKFKKSPFSWMDNNERKDTINKFCRLFAWTSDDWPEQWKKHLKSLP